MTADFRRYIFKSLDNTHKYFLRLFHRLAANLLVKNCCAPMRWQFSRDFWPAKRRRAVARQVTKGKKHRKGPRRGGRCSAPLVLSEESVYCLSARVRGTDYASFRIIGNANRHYANAFVYCRFRRFIGDRTCVSGMKHFIRSEGRSASCAAGDHRKRTLSARRGVDRKAGRFLSPRLRVLLWSFLPTREESGVPENGEKNN